MVEGPEKAFFSPFQCKKLISKLENSESETKTSKTFCFRIWITFYWMNIRFVFFFETWIYYTDVQQFYQFHDFLSLR